jgi:hypothetical protein
MHKNSGLYAVCGHVPGPVGVFFLLRSAVKGLSV